jgi:hypothetical protein
VDGRQQTSHKQQSHRAARKRHDATRTFWFELGRMIFPDLINHPRAMRMRVMVLTLGTIAILVGALIGFYRHANDPADILLIQARELHK